MKFFQTKLPLPPYSTVIVALVAGAIFPLSLAPFDAWPAALISIALLFQLSKSLPAIQAAWIGFAYGIGFFGTGASWVYVSIHNFGGANMLLAGLLTLIFVTWLALYFALQNYCFRKITGSSEVSKLFTFTAVWVLFELFRRWMLSGFPWLFAGYATIDNPLAGWAPVVGVYGCSFLMIFSAVALSNALPSSFINRLLPDLPANSPAGRPIQAAWFIAAILPWFGGYGLQQVNWVTPASDTADIKVALIQGNIAQQEKWKPENLPAILRLYQHATVTLPPQDLIIWPESALPQFIHNVEPFLQKVQAQLPEKTVLMTGLLEAVPTEKKGYKIYNAILTLGQQNAQQIYRKQKLVPFGEYVPLENYLRGMIEFFNLPMSKLAPGKDNQPLLRAGSLNIMGLICYEVAYPELARQQPSDLLLTISNDAWFGSSIGPLQHLQIAQFRALEIGRYLIRGTNNGVSAIVDEKGRIIKRTAQFKFEALTGQVKKMVGETPYFQYGSLPVLTLCIGILLILTILRLKQPGK